MLYQDDAGEAPPAPPPMQQPEPMMPAVRFEVTDPSIRRGAGVAIIGCGAAALVGGVVRGPLGAIAGVVGFGSVRNTLRAKTLWTSSSPDDRVEAGKSATLAVFGFGATGLLLYHAFSERS